MEKIPASKLVEADPDFVKDMYEKLNKLKEQEDDGLEEFDSDQAAFYLNVTAQTIRNHIKNYVRDREGKRIKAVKKGNRYIMLKKDLDHYKNNPKTILE